MIFDLIMASRGFLLPEISVPSNGSRPHRTAKRITPIDQMSIGGPVDWVQSMQPKDKIGYDRI
jgi:hypothetical protein